MNKMPYREDSRFKDHKFDSVEENYSSFDQIIKSDFFVEFKAAHNNVFTEGKIKSAFRGVNISP